MRKTLLAILVSTLLITNALAADDGHCAECIKLDQSTLLAGGQSLASLDEATRAIASESKEVVIDLETLRNICRTAELKRYDLMEKVLDQANLSLAENYLDIDCSRIGRVGPTLLHMIFNGDSTLFSLAQDIVDTIVEAKKENPELDTARFFNMKESFFSKKRTIVGIIDRTIKTVKEGGILHGELLDIKSKLINHLGAKLDPEATEEPGKAQ